MFEILRCAFCDAEYPPGTPPTQHERLEAHVMECEKHPLRLKVLRILNENCTQYSDGSWSCHIGGDALADELWSVFGGTK